MPSVSLTSYDLEKVMAAFEEQFGHLLHQVKWVNMGGGHLMTREGYDTGHLVDLLRGFRSRHPWLQVILEPGSAFTWRTGDLVTSVVDIVENDGINTAIVDVSFACHMPDTLEMPYKPVISEAVEPAEGLTPYRLGRQFMPQRRLHGRLDVPATSRERRPPYP